MAEHMIPVKLLDDVTECPICTDNYNDPRSLPCIHTFCFLCIAKWCDDKLPGESVNCPLCRKEFTIPAKGLEELPKNHFVGKVLTVKEQPKSASTGDLCDWCVADSDLPVERKNKAEQYCVECRKSLCGRCITFHARRKRCRSHQTLDIRQKSKDASATSCPTKCDKHPVEDIKVYCMECREALCLVCSATKHVGHKSAEIGEVAGEFRNKIKGHISRLECGMDYLAKSLSGLQNTRQDIFSQSDKMSAEIFARADYLHSTIELHKNQLLSELAQLKNDKLKEVDAVINEISQNKELVESFRRYSGEKLKTCSNGDLVRQMKAINARMANIEQLYDRPDEEPTLEFKVAFVESIDTTFDTSNAIGRLESSTASDQVLRPTLSLILPPDGDGRGFGAVTSFNNQLFVIRNKTKAIEVYDSSTFQLERLINLPDDAGNKLQGLAVCSVNDCLYVSDHKNDVVHKVNLSTSVNDGATTSKWRVADGPLGLSINKSSNVLVACFYADVVQEYASSGVLLRKIGCDVIDVRHALELPDGTFVVSHGCYISIISLDGSVLLRYPPTTATSELERLQSPGALAVDKNRFILVADWDRRSVLVLNPKLSDARLLTLDPSLRHPSGLWFTESCGRLYVSEDNDDDGESRVLAFDNVLNVKSLFDI